MESDLGNDTPKTDENSPTEVIDSKKPSDILGTITEVAKNGDPKYAWSYLKPILKERIEGVLTTLQETTPEVPAVRNVEPFVFEELKSKILSNLDSFNSAPFTIQRVCELLLHPEKHYKRIDKFMRGLEKNLLVVGTVEPGISYKMADEEKRYELMNGINDDKISPTPFAYQEGNVHSAEESLTGDVVTHFPVEKETNGSLSSSDTSSDDSAAELSPDEKEEAEPHVREDLESEPDTVIQQLKPLKSIEEGLEIHPEETLSIVTEVHQPTGEPVLFEKDLPAPGTETLLQPLPSDIVESPVNVLADEIPPTIEAITTSVITEVKEEVLIKVTEKSAIKEELVMTVDTVSSVNEVVSSVSETVSSVTEMVSLVTETVSSENETGLSVAETDVVKVSENMVEERGVKRSLEEGEEGIIKEKLPRLVSPEKAVQEIDLENIVDSPLERSLQEEEVASTEEPTVKETETSSEEKEDDEAAGAAETAEVPETIELEQNQQCLEDSAA